MATKSEVFDDSKSVAYTPPSYDTAISEDSIRCRQPSVLSFLRTNINALLYLYQRPRCCSLSHGVPQPFANAQHPGLHSDILCMITSDQASFVQLNLERTINPKDETLRHFLGCLPDEVQVHEGDGVDRNWQFVACFRSRMFQKRMCIIREEFVARGRIWLLRFDTGSAYRWRVTLSLSRDSNAAYTDTAPCDPGPQREI
ncbi:hypothetical protein F4604DRAFT_1914668 [Suillus subluteus]|nr:hypothetical protein F4604DRAFT_1914668 [Suillus subluteus]